MYIYLFSLLTSQEEGGGGGSERENQTAIETGALNILTWAELTIQSKQNEDKGRAFIHVIISIQILIEANAFDTVRSSTRSALDARWKEIMSVLGGNLNAPT